MLDLGEVIGGNQKRLRTEQGLSLEALARESGVSQSRLSQIERGEANPSIATVWQIASALKVGFSELVAEPENRSLVVNVHDTEPSRSEDGRYRAYPVFAFDAALGFEVYECEMDEGGVLTSVPHPAGTQETLTIVEGGLGLAVAGETFVLGPGEAIRFHADQPHEYRNESGATLRFSMIVAYARRG